MIHAIEEDHSPLSERVLLGRAPGLEAAGAATFRAAAVALETSPAKTPVKRSPERFFPGFTAFQIETEKATINGVTGGRGPPLLLLHGYPQTHSEWYRIAPALAERFTVVATDLRGYGDSSKPPDGVNHAGHSKRNMARDQVAVMEKLGFERFAVVVMTEAAA